MTNKSKKPAQKTASARLSTRKKEPQSIVPVKKRKRKLPTMLPGLDLWEARALTAWMGGASIETICKEMSIPQGSVEAVIDKVTAYRTLTDPEQARGKQAWLVNSLTGTERKALKLLLHIAMGETGQEVNPGLILAVADKLKGIMRTVQPKGPSTQVQVGVAVGGREGAGQMNFERILRGVKEERGNERQEDEGEVQEAEFEEVSSGDTNYQN